MVSDVLHVVCDFGELVLEVLNPPAEGLLCLSKAAGHFRQRFNPKLWNEYPNRNRAPAKKPV
jgi:hypothetical protein